MTPETQKFYDNYFEMFGSPGWKQYIEQLVTDLTGGALVTAVKTASNDLDLGVLKGRVELAEMAIGLESTVRFGYEQELEDDQA